MARPPASRRAQRVAPRTDLVLERLERCAPLLEIEPLLTALVRHGSELAGSAWGVIGRVPGAGDGGGAPFRVEVAHGAAPSGRSWSEAARAALERGAPTAAGGALWLPLGEGDAPALLAVALPPEAERATATATLALFARHAGALVRNAQRFEGERRRSGRLATASRIGRLMNSSLSLTEVLQTAVEALRGGLGFASAGIFLVSTDEPRRLVLRARSGPGGRTLRVGEYSQAFGEGNVGLAAERRSPVFVPDAGLDRHYLRFPGAERLRSEYAVPIVVGELLLGVLNVESELRIRSDDRAAVELVAAQLGVSIDNARLFAATEEALGEMQLLYESSQRISMAMDVSGVVEAYLRQVATRRRYRCSVATFEFDATGAKTHIELLGRWVPGEGVTLERFQVPYFRDGFDDLLDRGETVTIENVATDDRASETLKRAQLERGYPALALIPLIARGRRIGVVALSHRASHGWSEADLRPYQVTAAQLATAIHSRVQQGQLQQGRQRLALLGERQRLARELHDSVTQVIFGMTLVAQTIGTAMRRDPAEGEARVARLLELGRKARAEMRALLAELRPADGEADIAALPDRMRVREYGLVPALRSLLDERADTFPSVRLDANDYRPHGPEIEEALYRIAQEALTNVAKHADAERATVRLWVEDGWIHLGVEDDGRGFAPGGVGEAGGEHLGLNTMRERAAALGGTIDLDSRPGDGTVVAVRIPRP